MAIIRFLPKFDLVFNTDKGQFEWIDPADDFYDSISGKGVTQVTLSGIFWLTLTLRLKNGNVKQFTQFRFGLDVSKLRESLQAYEQYVMDEKEADGILSELGTEGKIDSIIPEKSPYYRDGNQAELDTTNSVVEYASTETRPDFVDHASERTHEEKIKAKGVSFEEVMNIEIMKTRVREELVKNPDAEFDEDNLEMRFVGMKDFIRDTRLFLKEITQPDEATESSNDDTLTPLVPVAVERTDEVDPSNSDLPLKDPYGDSIMKVVVEGHAEEADDENFAFPAGDFSRDRPTGKGNEYIYLQPFSTEHKWDVKAENGHVVFIDNVKRHIRTLNDGKYSTIPFDFIKTMGFDDQRIYINYNEKGANCFGVPENTKLVICYGTKFRRTRKEFDEKLKRMRKRING